jgi:preprotein translocase subunit SecF
MIRIFHNSTFHFVKHWRIAAILTAVFIAAGLVSFGITGKPNLSIEFTGGTLMQVEFTQAPDVAVVRSTLDEAGVKGAEIQQFGSATEYTIRARSEQDVAAQDRGAESIKRQITTALESKFGKGKVRMVRAEAVSAKVGDELASGAAMAMLIASLFTLIYLAIRFDWRFGLAAVLSTAHDILVTFAFIKIFHVEVSLTVVAAILTLLGYSANDTIIIFDRVRENLRKPHKGMTLGQLLDKSINETLPRSIMTHATVLAATVALLVLAGEVIRPFAWVMTFGVFIATFSSIYVAGPVLLWIESKYPRAEDSLTARAARGGSDAPTAPAAPTRGGRTPERLASR